MPIVEAMDTLKTPMPATARPGPALTWRARHAWHAWAARCAAVLQRLGRSDEDRFLDGARDLADLEARQRRLGRHGLPPARWPLD